MLEVRHLMVFYENALAINDLSLDVHRGEVVAVFGSNSAGKSTLLNTIAGLTQHLQYRERRKGGLRITLAGSIVFEGRDITALPAEERVRLGIALCRERHPIFRECTVEENLRLGAYVRGPGRLRHEIEHVMDLFPPLRRLRTARAGMLSGGEQEMVALGMALMARPGLLLLDEPLLGLSPAIQAEVVRVLREIRHQGMTILVTEQYARPLFPVIDRAYVIESGSSVVAGSRDELLEHPEVRSAYFGTYARGRTDGGTAHAGIG
jgi:branched-chain amino acid transport system ATP-binding protein